MKYVFLCVLLVLSACEDGQEQPLPIAAPTSSHASAAAMTEAAENKQMISPTQSKDAPLPTSTTSDAAPVQTVLGDDAKAVNISTKKSAESAQPVIVKHNLSPTPTTSDAVQAQPALVDAKAADSHAQKSAESHPYSKPAVVADPSPTTLPVAELVPRQPALVDRKPDSVQVPKPVVSPDVSEVLSEVARVGDAGRGQVVAKKCAACHTFVQGGQHKVGPNLFGIVGKPQGGAADYSYGSYLAAQQGVWNEANLRAWINDSKAIAKDAGATTKMPSQKISGKKADDLLAYLRTLR